MLTILAMMNGHLCPVEHSWVFTVPMLGLISSGGHCQRLLQWGPCGCIWAPGRFWPDSPVSPDGVPVSCLHFRAAGRQQCKA